MKKWKGEVDKAKGVGDTPNGERLFLCLVDANKDRVCVVQTQGIRRQSASLQSPTPASPLSAAAAVRTAKTDGVPTDALGDKVRDKCTEMLYDALAFDSGARTSRTSSFVSLRFSADLLGLTANDQLNSRARAIEEIVYAQHSYQTSGPYRSKMRSLYLNLKDKSNPSLRESVVSGDLPAAQLCKMSSQVLRVSVSPHDESDPCVSSQEMASEDRKQADNKINQANFYSSLGSEEMAAETDAFQCGRCKQVRPFDFFQHVFLDIMGLA